VLQILLVTFPFFALPCLLYRFGAMLPVAQLLDASVFFVYLACGLMVVAFAIAISFNARIRWNDASFGALVAAFPNTGYMGVPLLVALLGPKAAGPAIITILADLLITSSLCIALSRLDGADEHGAAKAARSKASQ
jgi:malonate transporter and related proteins